ncbi:MAG TPA: shikimate kinase [Candidatus Borkfalkia stercoripullorum]|nr:shikimate kinase [Candidatus Borkfalkia stercoripullorum]
MDNVILIGMPASGKSTAGVLLAKTIGYGYIDSDLLIQNEENALLCDIIAREGAEGFIGIEERVNASIRARRCVISTGGSAVYGEKAMAHLKSLGTVVYLRVGLKELEKRLAGKDIFRRGVVMRKKGETLAELYAERAPLYEKYADITVDCDGLDIGGTVAAVAARVFRRKR